jgi:hypothetical protein
MNKVFIDKINLNLVEKYFLEKIILQNLKNHMYCVGNIKSTYHVDAFLHRKKNFFNLTKKINSTAKKIFNKNIHIACMWANVGEYGSKVQNHNHLEDDYSAYKGDQYFKSFGICGSFYLRKPKLSGDFVADGKIIRIQENEILFFSPHLVHCTEKNKSNKKRIVISFNGYFVDPS